MFVIAAILEASGAQRKNQASYHSNPNIVVKNQHTERTRFGALYHDINLDSKSTATDISF